LLLLEAAPRYAHLFPGPNEVEHDRATARTSLAQRANVLLVV
jgi:hypothetical protein